MLDWIQRHKWLSLKRPFKVEQVSACWRRHIVLANLILIVGAVGLAVLVWHSGAWFYAGSRETFGPLGSYIFVCSSIVIASLAAMNAIYASTMASESQRPFMTVLGDVNSHVQWHHERPKPAEGIFHYVVVHVCNSGILPADKVSFHCVMSGSTESAKLPQLLIARESPPSTYFPNVETQSIFELDSGLIVQPGAELRFQITIAYSNKTTGKKHETIRSYSMKCDPQVQRATPLPKEDYWD